MLGRVVLHAVYDGVRASNAAPLVTSGTQLTPAPSDFFIIGNRQTGLRSPEAWIHYAAVYGSALTMAQVNTNVAILQVSDDP